MTDSLNAEAKQAYLAKAAAIAEARNMAEDQSPSQVSDAEIDAYFAQLEADKTAALNARRLSEDEMIATAREFIVSTYGLNEEQTGRLDLYTNASPWAEANSWYYMVDGKPCFKVEYLLYGENTEQDGLVSRTEKDGYYNVFVNVETGVVEEYEYNSALAGVG